MRIAPTQPKVTWKVAAVVAKEPLAFAEDLQRALQEMTDDGFQIVSQALRDNGSVILTGQKVELPDAVQDFLSFTLPQVASATEARSRSRRIVEPRPAQEGVAGKEVLYNFLEDGRLVQRSFHQLVDALRVVKEHLDRADDYFVPISVMVVSTTRFDPKALPSLMRTFAYELKSKPLE